MCKNLMITIILYISLLITCNSFIVSTYKGYRKCFKTDVSQDKVLHILIMLDVGGKIWISQTIEAKLLSKTGN